MNTTKLTYLKGYPLDKDQLEWIPDAKGLKSALIKHIQQAQKRIYLVALYIENDEAGRTIFSELIAAKTKNPRLDIKVFVDFHRAKRGRIGEDNAKGSDDMYRRLLREAGVQFEVYGVPVKTKEVFGVLHLKGFIFDDTVIYSGASINDIYLYENDRYRFDRYHIFQQPQLVDAMAEYVNHVLLTSPQIQSLLSEEEQPKREISRFIRRYKKRLMKHQYRQGSSRIGTRVTPLVGLGKRSNQLNKTIVELLKGSQQELFICTPYFNLPTKLKRSLGAKLRAGCKVDIIVGDKTSNDFYIPPEEDFNIIGAVPYLYEQSLRRFLKKFQWAIDKKLLNVYLWKHESHSFHLKGVFVDKYYYLLTGNNLNPRAWSLDLENALLVHDEQKFFEKEFEHEKIGMLEHASRLENYRELEEINDYPDAVKGFMKKIHRFKIDTILRKIL